MSLKHALCCGVQPGPAQGRCAGEARDTVWHASEQPVQRQGLRQQQGGQPAQGRRLVPASGQRSRQWMTGSALTDELDIGMQEMPE